MSARIISMVDFYRTQAIHCRAQAAIETDPDLIKHWLAGAAVNATRADALERNNKPCDVE